MAVPELHNGVGTGPQHAISFTHEISHPENDGDAIMARRALQLGGQQLTSLCLKLLGIQRASSLTEVVPTEFWCHSANGTNTRNSHRDPEYAVACCHKKQPTSQRYPSNLIACNHDAAT